MFWRKTRAAIEQLHPAHQGLIWHRVLNTTLDGAGWAHLTHSLRNHSAVVTRAKWALPPRSLDVVAPLIDVLRQDLAPGGALAVAADLRGPRLPEKSGPRRELPVRPPVRRATEWYVVDPWLRLRADLHDGSVLEIAVVDRVRHRQVTKVNPRGKRKSKTKLKEVQLVRVSRTMPRGVTGRQPAHPPPPWIRVKLRPGKRQGLTATGKLGRLTAGPEQVHHILTVVAEPFRWSPPGAGRPARGAA
jgi:hypothetical protein